MEDGNSSHKTGRESRQITKLDASVVRDERLLAAAERFRPEVALLDIGLPRLNGYDAARRIREQPWGKDMVLVALTGWGQEEDRRKSKEAGFDLHMVKPVDLELLMERLASLPLGSRR